MKAQKESEISTIISVREPKESVKAVVILLHGLNLAPQKMDDWAMVLAAHGALVMQFSLYGHSGDQTQMHGATASIWHEQFQTTFLVASEKAKTLDVPLYFMGFSLGALVALEWLSTQKDLSAIERMVFIAPALAIPWYSRGLIKAFSFFGKNVVLPSRSPKTYRANPGTSIAAYLALFELKDSLEERKYRFTNVDTLILIDRHDELVNSEGIRELIIKHGLSRWRLEMVDNRFAYDNYGFRHLMVDQEAMGKELWQNLSHLVLDHFHLSTKESH